MDMTVAYFLAYYPCIFLERIAGIAVEVRTPHFPKAGLAFQLV
jgi:hypothetical protein